MKKTTLLFLAVLLSGTAYAQNTLVKLYESDPGVSLAGFFSPDNIELIIRFDADGNGIPDLFMTRKDEQGSLTDILVVDARTQVVLWEMRDLHITLTVSIPHGIGLYGFVDADGDETREALFYCLHLGGAHETEGAAVALVDPRDNTIEFEIRSDQPARLVGAVDLTGDTYEEFVIYLPDTEQIQVWGKP